MLCDSQNKRSEILQGLYTLDGSLNGLYKYVHASYTLCSSENGLPKHLHASYTRCGDQNGPSDPQLASSMLYGS